MIATAIRRIYDWCRSDRGDSVSAAWRWEHAKYEATRGVDLPTWRSPAEVSKMRRLERRRGLRLVTRA